MSGAVLVEAALADWRRRVADMYRRVREAPPGRAAETLAAFRAERDALFRTHPSSPLEAARRAGFDGLRYFAHDPGARVVARLEPVADSPFEEAILGEDGLLRFRRVAVARFALHGREYRLGVYALAGYGGGLWLPFLDATSGSESYGGGRYLYDTIKGADLGVQDDRMPLDFNYAYNPSCAYDARWVCPLAPRHDRIEVAIRAGERSPPDR